MLNIISTNKAPNFQYTDEMDRFLMNTLAFSVGLVTEDYSTFDPEVLKIMEEEPNCLLNLYDRARQRELTSNEDNLFLNIHDKFLALLLTDDELITNLLEVE